MAHKVVILAVALVWAAGSPAVAGILADHTKVRIQNGPGLPPADIGTELAGDRGALLTHEREEVSRVGVQYTYTRAETNADARNLIRLETHAIDEEIGTFTQASARANAAWSDIITYAGGSTPAYLTLAFRVTGVLAASRYSDAGITASFHSNLTLNARGLYNNRTLDYHIVSTGGVLSIGDGFTGVEYDPETGAFSGIMTYQAPYNRTYGGYGWNLQVTSGSTAGFIANSGGNFGWAYTRFGHTISLESLSLPDGTILSDSDVAFDSGLTLASVPEPSSLIAAGTAAVVMAVAARRRRAG